MPCWVSLAYADGNEVAAPDVHAGDEITVTTADRRPDLFRDEGAFDRRGFSALQNIDRGATHFHRGERSGGFLFCALPRGDPGSASVQAHAPENQKRGKNKHKPYRCLPFVVFAILRKGKRGGGVGAIAGILGCAEPRKK